MKWIIKLLSPFQSLCDNSVTEAIIDKQTSKKQPQEFMEISVSLK